MNIFLNSGQMKENSDCVSSIVALGDFVYTSALEGKGETIEEQSINALNALIDALASFDLSLYHCVKYTVYLTNIHDRDAFLSVFKNYVEAPYPAVSFVGVSALENNATVAIEALAINTLRHEHAASEHSCSGGCDGCGGGCGGH